MEFGLAYLGIGFALAFLGIFGYVISIARRQKSLDTRMEALDRANRDP
ncbi:MAG: CcmD family protein [Actinobacteria bacterium]|nr:CcmD family protein [Actinomycetota bacterium]